MCNLYLPLGSEYNNVKLFIKIIVISIVFLPSTPWAGGNMPCEQVKEPLKKTLSYFSKKQTPVFLNCISNYRVCAVAGGRVIASTLIKEIPNIDESTTVVIVQSPPNDELPVCLIGSYSGGSAAAWTFDAYKIINGNAVAFRGMNKAYAQGDAVSPKSAAIMTYEMYEKYAEK